MHRHHIVHNIDYRPLAHWYRKTHDAGNMTYLPPPNLILAVCVHLPTAQTSTSGTAGNTRRREGILRQADTCVKCGLCLPHCPTYRQTEDEAESPRGRIALIQGWLSGAIPGDERLHGHLNRCLQCGACEKACPSLVPFVNMMDQARAQRTDALPQAKRQLRRWVADRLAHPSALHRLLRLYQRSGLRALTRASGLLRMTGLTKLEQLGADLAQPAAATPDAAPLTRGTILIYSGCVGRHLDAGAHAAAIRVLQHLGYSVELPRGDHCCGALHRHDGFEEAAEKLLDASRACFARAEQPPVLGLASACTAELRRNPELASVVRDASRFLADLDWPEALRPRPYDGRVLVHIPCSQANLLGDPGAAVDLLRLIPGLEPVELTDHPFCCGAAGAYLLREAEMAQRLLDDKLTAIRDCGANTLVTTNTGCAAHLRSGIEQAGLSIQVCHPVELLARQLPT